MLTLQLLFFFRSFWSCFSFFFVENQLCDLQPYKSSRFVEEKRARGKTLARSIMIIITASSYDVIFFSLFQLLFFFSSSKVVYSHCYKYSICTWLPVGHSEFPLSLQLRAAVAKRVSTERKRKKNPFFPFPPFKNLFVSKVTSYNLCTTTEGNYPEEWDSALPKRKKIYIYNTKRVKIKSNK